MKTKELNDEDGDGEERANGAMVSEFQGAGLQLCMR
jgi:hypothetical protein